MEVIVKLIIVINDYLHYELNELQIYKQQHAHVHA